MHSPTALLVAGDFEFGEISDVVFELIGSVAGVLEIKIYV